MQTGKLPEAVLKRSVFKRIKKPPHIGEDYSAIEGGENELIVTGIGAFPDLRGEYMSIPIISAINNVATSGAEPVGITVTAFLPEAIEEREIKELSDEMEALREQLDIRLMGGHTQVTDAVDRPTVSVTAYGKVKKGEVIASDGAKPGDEIVATKWIGLSGTEILAKERESIISQKLKGDIINTAKMFGEMISVLPEARVARQHDIHAMHDLSQGGVYNGLWEMASASKVGLSVDLKKIPIRQETVEICEIFDINPYRLLSHGSMLMATPTGEELVEALLDRNISASVIGRFTDSNDRIIINGDEVTYLDSPKQEELIRIIAERRENL